MTKPFIALQPGATEDFLPRYETEGAAGMDLKAFTPNTKETVIAPGSTKFIPTGINIALPLGLEAQVRSRSGLSLKHGVIVLNSPGTVDSDYRGELGIILYNAGPRDYIVQHGDRIAQMVIGYVVRADFELTTIEGLPDTCRGSGGFGSTGR